MHNSRQQKMSLLQSQCKWPTCIKRLEAAVIAAVASDFDRWCVFFVGVVNSPVVVPDVTGGGKAWDPDTDEGLKGDL